MSSVSMVTAVVGHPARALQAKALADEVLGQLFLDEAGAGEWLNHLRALRWGAQARATHLCVLQDDAVPGPHFTEDALEAARRKPRSVIGLYVGTGRPAAGRVSKAVAKADAKGASWLASPDLHWGVGTIFPVADLVDLVGWCRRSRALPYDQRVSAWLRHRERDAWYTWPSLVDHLDQPSVIKGRAPEPEPRVAHRTGRPTFRATSARISSRGATVD